MKKMRLEINNILMGLCVLGLNIFALTLGRLDAKLSIVGAFITIALLFVLIGKEK